MFLDLTDNTQYSTRDTDGRLAPIMTHSCPTERHEGNVTEPADTHQMYVVFSVHRDITAAPEENMHDFSPIQKTRL